ncbi:CubicO group peptidase, beta-lactamase class C family [Carnobacterium iners]|uniref:CubicO group peptidase, beta-lactamase class C family n=1 Tax=Carnobacterium iners TaxID=1073423 RepID=A0A1X7N704_9LACT|nr:serine hydrolase domain-containing protein [Carnobacterium iners]SEK44471.1 CubicO group peptidase, beta-lactamase class C family [Carnobacterium iners]SMH32720.1 CubicO group peptidase, beta-lactamase class C family [Carnobacterium iners]
MYPKTRKAIQKLIEEAIIPGASYAFIKNNQQDYYREGLAAVYPEKEPIQENQQYDVASLTKVMLTTTVTLQLLESNKLVLEDSVHTYLPLFKSKKVTIRHLLTHTSALNGFIPNRNKLSASELESALLSITPDKTVGEKVVYADINMILLGYIIELIEKDTLVKIFEKRILGPMNLTDSTYHPTDSFQCAPTENHPQQGVLRGKVHDPKAQVLGDHCGSAGLFSTLHDTTRFSQMMLQKGRLDGIRILNEETIFELTKDQTPNKTLNRSLGWDLLTRKEENILFHTGFTGTFILLSIYRKEAFIFLSNRVHPTSDTVIYLEKRNHLIETYFSEVEAE